MLLAVDALAAPRVPTQSAIVVASEKQTGATRLSVAERTEQQADEGATVKYFSQTTEEPRLTVRKLRRSWGQNNCDRWSPCDKQDANDVPKWVRGHFVNSGPIFFC